MHSIVYLSSAVEKFTTDDLKQILITSRRNNGRNGITGMLLYSDGNIIQVLEGEEERVKATYERIEKDYRHRGIIQLISGKVAVRNFPEWSMGFKDISSEDFKRMAGYADPTDKKFLKNATVEQDAITLLKIFASDNIR